MAFCNSIKKFVMDVCLCMLFASFDCFCGATGYIFHSSTVFFSFLCFVFVFLYIHISVHCEFSVYIVNIFDVFSLLSVLSQQTCSTLSKCDGGWLERLCRWLFKARCGLQCHSLACSYLRGPRVMQCTPGILLSVCHLVCFRGYKLQEAHSTDEGGMERRSEEKGISSPALYLLPAEPEEIIFQSPIHRTSSLMYSPLLWCVYVCPTLHPSPTLTVLPGSPRPLLFPPSPSLSILLSVPISVPCISFSSPARLWGRSCFIAVVTRDPFETCCTHACTYTHNKHTGCSAAAVKLSLTFTHRNITVNLRSVAENERGLSSCGCCKSVLVWGERGQDAEGP